MRKYVTSNTYTLLIFLSILLTLMTVILSAYIRLSINGLGCEDWPECFGHVGAVSQYEAMASFTDAIPGKPHGTARIMHRVVASVLGIFVIVILIMAFRLRKQGGPGVSIPVAVLAITLFLSILGYSTPSPWIPVVTLGNLLGGMLMLALLWWLWFETVSARLAPVKNSHALKPWAIVGIVVVLLQICSGAWVSANYAGPSCTSLTTCQGNWLPTSGLIEGLSLFRELQVDAMGKIIPDDSMPAIHMLHRLISILGAIYLIWFGTRLTSADSHIQSNGHAIIVLVLIQIGLGIFSILKQLPLGLVTAHNAVAAMLLLTITGVNHLLFRKT
jgi:cytochrome c oxidase assembly protein subunit 15